MTCLATNVLTAASASLSCAIEAMGHMPLQDCSAPDYGEFVDSDDEWEIEEIAESPELYQQGSYYPIRIGEVLAQTYRVEHKLGHGGFSTVWMAHDIKSKRDVALKIMTPGDSGEYEYTMQKEIIRTVQNPSHFLTCHGTFSLRGYHGNHRVLVFPVAGPSLGSCLRQISVATRMSAARQLLQAVKSLHQSGIVHGDLSNRNVMWGIAPLDNYSTATKYEHLGRPKKMPLRPEAWRGGELVKPMEVPKNLLTETVYLGDFGLAIKAGTPVTQKVQSPAIYCAPERLHDADPSFATDIWSYMCLFAELYLGVNPFYCLGNVVSHMVDVLGPLPAQWKGHYKAGGTSDPSWYDQRRKPEPRVSLEAMIGRARPETSSTERHHVTSFMSKGFCYLPEQRLTASQLLQDTSFKAIMKIYGH